MVPKKVTVCRCGHQWKGTERTGVIGTEPAAALGEIEPAPSTAGSPWPIVAVLALVAVAGAAFLLRSRPADGPARTPAAATDSETASETPGSAPATQPVKTWPTDPSLWKDGAAPKAPAAPLASAAPAATMSLEDVVSASLPAVVLVQTTDARGTGFFVSSDTVITNAHVVDGATYVTLRTSFGDETPAMVTVRSNELDLAELHVSKSRPGQVTLPLTDSSHVRVGEEVVAIGSAMGLQNTVTRGIVSSLRRLGSVTLVQTDAAINHGNSGGPLLNMNAQVIGVNTLVVRDASMGDQAEGLGFAISSNTAHTIADQLMKNGSVVRPYLGVSYQTLNPQSAAVLGVSRTQGAYLSTVQAASPAAQAGLRAGDIITSIDGQALSESHTLQTVLLAHKPGDRLSLKVARTGTQADVTLTVTLGKSS
jgi:S1-C subfamily serine protease